MKQPRALILGVTVLATAACGTEPALFRVGCSHIESIEVGSGLTPSIDWSPDCNVAAVSIYESEPRTTTPGEDPLPPFDPPIGVPGRMMWAVYSPDSLGNLLEAKIRYGRVPGHGLEFQAAAPLQVGRPYLVELTVLRADGLGTFSRWAQFAP